MANITTSGAGLYNPQLTEIVEEAFERAGTELRSGYDLRTARRSLNIMFAEWANRGINMWTMDQQTITLAQGQSTYAIPSDTVDLLEQVIRTQANSTSNQSDLNITRISVSTYQTIPNKLQQARPIQILVNRQDAQQSPTTITVASAVAATDTTITLTSTVGLPAYGFISIDQEIIFYQYISGNTINTCARGQNNTTAASHAVAAPVLIQYLPSVTVWPVPDGSQTYTLAYVRLRRTQDAGGGVNVMDIPFRFLPCMIAGLAYYLAMKLPPTPDMQNRLILLKQQYDEAWQMAAEEDREKAAIRFVPREMFIGNSY